MNFLILGDGREEIAWAQAIETSQGHRLITAFPGVPGVAPARDIEEALATDGIEAAVVGGDAEFRAEALRRVAAIGLPTVCLHPPGPDSEAYYQVSMSRAETGAVLVPDLPERLHPGVTAFKKALETEELGAFRGLRYDAASDPAGGDLVRFDFARIVDVVRFLLGEIEAVTATGDPPGEHPSENLVVQLRCARSYRAEVRLRSGPPGPALLALTGVDGSLTLELPMVPATRARLVRRASDGSESASEFDDWNPHAAILSILEKAATGGSVHPDLLDGTRAMEVAEAVVRSLRRGRTVDLHYEEISEVGTFKSVMTSFGCLVLVASLFALPIALAGPALGMGWTIYIAYLIPPALLGFVLLQLFRFALREPRRTPDEP